VLAVSWKHEVRARQLIRRSLLVGGLAAPFVWRPRPSRGATTIRMGTAKPIHAVTPNFYRHFMPDGVAFEIIPVKSSIDGKDAVVSGSAEFGTFGIAFLAFGSLIRRRGNQVRNCYDPRFSWAAARVTSW
jgi:NitT/TauT family transport system substrate-binding protein